MRVRRMNWAIFIGYFNAPKAISDFDFSQNTRFTVCDVICFSSHHATVYFHHTKQYRTQNACVNTLLHVRASEKSKTS